MSLNIISTYFRNIGLSRGLKEHKNPFSFKDIPASTFDKIFHIESISFPPVKQNQIDLEIEIPTTVRIFIKGFNDVLLNKERCITECENYFTSALKVENRLMQTNNIKNIRLINFFVEPFDESNDNWIIGKMDFSIKYIKIIESEA